MQLVDPRPARGANQPRLGPALRKRFCRSFDFELQAAADDDGIVLSLGPQHSFADRATCSRCSTPHNVKYLLEQALLAVPMFQVALAVERHALAGRPHGSKAANACRRTCCSVSAATICSRRVFPKRWAAWRTITATWRFPTIRWCSKRCTTACTEAMDIDALIDVHRRRVRDGQIAFVGRDTRELFAVQL